MSASSVPPSGEGSNYTSSSSSSQGPVAPLSPNDAIWLKFAQQLFPNDPNAAQYIAPLQRNMLTMINTTINEMNARIQTEQDWEKQQQDEENS